MKVAFLLLALAACEHADSTAHQPPAPPPPDKPDPVKQAREEFELIPAEYAVGTSKLYSRGDFLTGGSLDDDLDEGDFIGRLRTLFGPRDEDNYVLRDRKTGWIVTAYSGASGPSYGAGARYPGALPTQDPRGLMKQALAEDPGREARIKADPVLQGERPPPTDLARYRAYERHFDDAVAGPERAAVIARLDALVSLVPPADYSETKYYEDEPTVYRVGAKGGHSFNEELPADEGMAFLVAQTKTEDGWERDVDLISYYLEHQADLAPHKPEALAALAHLSEVAKREPDKDMREQLNEQLRDYKKQLR